MERFLAGTAPADSIQSGNRFEVQRAQDHVRI
jgi:hypothetical protein